MIRKAWLLGLLFLLLTIYYVPLGKWEWLAYAAAPVFLYAAVFTPKPFRGNIPPLFKNRIPRPEQIAKEDYSRLPESIKGKAFCAPNGEVAWKKADLNFVFSELAKAGFANLGTELWVVEEDRIIGLIPMKDGGTGVCGWDTASKGETEGWMDYVRRTESISKDIVANDTYENDIAPEVAEKVFYNVTFVSEEKYRKLGKS